MFVCTGNSARSQIAQALLRARDGGRRFDVESAGSNPAPEVHPLALEVLDEAGVSGRGLTPKRISEVSPDRVDLVITLCGAARESCPVWPAAAAVAHWPLDDPAAVTGSAEQRLERFRRTLVEIAGRVERLCELPLESMTGEEIERAVASIGQAEG